MIKPKGFEEWYYNPVRFIRRATVLQKIFAVFFIILIIGIIQKAIEFVLAGAIVLIIFIAYAVIWLRGKIK